MTSVRELQCQVVALIVTPAPQETSHDLALAAILEGTTCGISADTSTMHTRGMAICSALPLSSFPRLLA